jgi:NADPH-dependent glutamate synthase beta subunit-like oxidoreductase
MTLVPKGHDTGLQSHNREGYKRVQIATTNPWPFTRLIASLALEKGWTIRAGASTGKRVVVVGAGPAGLSCAYHLRRLGHEVEVRDGAEEPGGMMRYGIPAYRLPRDGVAQEIARIEAMGVKIVRNHRVTDVLAD